MLNSFQDCVNRYGQPWESDLSRANFESKWMTLLHLDQFQLPFKRIYCNKDISDLLVKSFQSLKDSNCLSEIQTFDGCWNIRPIRGTTNQWSQHSFGTAIDLNAQVMPLGSPSKWTPKFVETMKSVGWVFGGDFHRLDPQHFQLAHNC